MGTKGGNLGKEMFDPLGAKLPPGRIVTPRPISLDTLSTDCFEYPLSVDTAASPGLCTAEDL